MARLITPLVPNVPIVDKQGNPTPYFSRLLDEISDAKISASVIDALGGDPGGDRVVVWDDATGDLAFMTTSEVLDFITGASHGDILFRGSAGWETLDAGTAGQLLQTNGTGADPEWVDAPTGGGSTGEIALSIPSTSDFTYIGGASGGMTSLSTGIAMNAPNNGATYMAVARYNGAMPAFATLLATVRAKRAGGNSATGGSNGGIILRNSTSGRMIFFGDTSNGDSWTFQRWQNMSTVNATIGSGSIDGRGASKPWRRFRISGGLIIPEISADGEFWDSFGASENPATYINAAGGTVDQVCIGHHTILNNWNRSHYSHFSVA